MQKNISVKDKATRLMFGVLVALLYFFKVISGTTAIVLAIAAVILAFTAFINWCPIYAALGISTHKKDKENKTDKTA